MAAERAGTRQNCTPLDPGMSTTASPTDIPSADAEHQILTGVVTFGCCVGFLASASQYYSGLVISAIWASGVGTVLAILGLIFFQRPLESIHLALTLEALTLADVSSAVACLVGYAIIYEWQGSQFWAAVPTAIIALLAHAATGWLTVQSYREHLARTKPSDPLKPYLMKKEIDVWCYPVQNEQGQLFMDYEPVSATGSSAAPSIHSSRARSVKSFVRVEDQPSERDPGRPLSTVETTAGWSVPSQNETLQQSQRAPSTALPSYRSPNPTIRN